MIIDPDHAVYKLYNINIFEATEQETVRYRILYNLVEDKKIDIDDIKGAKAIVDDYNHDPFLIETKIDKIKDIFFNPKLSKAELDDNKKKLANCRYLLVENSYYHPKASFDDNFELYALNVLLKIHRLTEENVLTNEKSSEIIISDIFKLSCLFNYIKKEAEKKPYLTIDEVLKLDDEQVQTLMQPEIYELIRAGKKSIAEIIEPQTNRTRYGF